MTSMLGSKLPAEAVSAQQKVYVTYFFSEENEDRSQEGECSITLLESPSIISSSGTTGLRTWEAALFLGKYLKSNSDSSLIGDKTVLELGSGTGLVSILCARELQARRVVCTDGDEGVVDAIKVNVFLNGLEHSNKIEAAVLRWGHFLRIEEFEEDFAVKGLDVVLGADVVSPVISPAAMKILLKRPLDIRDVGYSEPSCHLTESHKFIPAYHRTHRGDCPK